MAFNFNKLFNGGHKKALVGLKSLARVLGSQEWDNTGFVERYAKSIYVFAAIQKIAQKTSTIEVELKQVLNSNGDVKDIDSHPLLDLLYKPNPFQTKSEFLKTAIINKKLCGEIIILKVRDNGGNVVELWNLRPDLITVVSDPELFIKAYEMQGGDGKKIIFRPEDIIHSREPNPADPTRGLSALRPAQYRIETEEYANKYQRDFFLNNARPDALLLSDDLLDERQKKDMRVSFNAKHKGIGKNSQINVLEGGVRYQQVSVSQREMDYVESMRFTRDDILTALGVPKAIITTDDVNLANANTAMFVFLSETIKPEMESLVDTFNEMLVIPEFGDTLYFSFIDPTPENREAKMAEYTAGVDKWLTRNEIRTELGLEPAAGGDELYNTFSNTPIGSVPQDDGGEDETITERAFKFKGKYALKQKLQLIEKIVDEVGVIEKEVLAALKKNKKMKKLGPKKKGKKKKYISVINTPELRVAYSEVVNKAIDKRGKKFKRTVENLAHEQEKRVLDALEVELKAISESSYEKEIASGTYTLNALRAKAYKEKLGPFSILRFFNKKREDEVFSGVALPFLTNYLMDAGNEALDMVKPGQQMQTNAQIERFLKKRANLFADAVNNTTLTKLTETLAEGIDNGEGIADLTARVKETYNEFDTFRAELIARTETTAVNNQGFIEGYQQSNVVEGKEWISTNDDRTREAHMEGVGVGGEKVGINENFSNGLAYPGDASGDAEEVINCRCVLGPVVIED